MSAPIVLAIGVLGGTGALARFLLDGAIARRVGNDYPFGTLAVNLSGSFLLGLLVGLAPEDDPHRLVGAGLLGAYTTFSTWAFESHRLGEDGQLGWGVLNLAASLVLGVGAVWLGRRVGAVL